jgi:signal transduction histidine kinase
VDQAFHYALKRITSEGLWKYAQIYTPLPDEPGVLAPSYWHSATDDPRLLKLQDAATAVRVRGAEGPVGRVRESGAVEWASRVEGRSFAEAGLHGAVIFPVIADRKVVAVVECLTDAELEEDPHLTEVMAAVGIELGLIVERKQLQEGYTEAVWQQQRRTAQELHDGLGQRLTGLWLLGTSLSEKLKATDHSPLARKLADGLEETVEQIRGLAKGVFPVDLDSEGLMTALKELTEAMGSASGVACRFECPDPVLLDDNRVAMHLYRIAQEAMTNALKHGKPGAVVVGLRPTEEGVQLQVSDDGAGLPASGDRREGSGLRIMRYRAAAMDAILKIDSSAGQGTRISCLAPRGPKG